MYADADDASDAEEDFLYALSLLHSTEDDSAETLRKMLDAAIEKKCGYGKTLMARMPEKFVQNPRVPGTALPEESINDSEDMTRRIMHNESTRSVNFEASSRYINNCTIENSSRRIEIFDMEIEDYSEKGDIPRISIPDEGSSDGLLCKICNGAKLGPLILLECQECQDVYHPLCHQPPVVDIDVYDPRIVWCCRKCVETSTVGSPASTFEEETLEKLDAIKAKEISTRVDRTRNANTSFRKSESTFDDCDSMDIIREGNSAIHEQSFAKDSTSLTQQGSNTLPPNQLRKRIGSKLSVTRAIIR